MNRILVREGLRFRVIEKMFFGEMIILVNIVRRSFVIPKSKGGHRTWCNIVSSCHKCNNKKGSKTLEEANMKPLNEPIFPYVKITDLYRNIKIPDIWEPFLF